MKLFIRFILLSIIISITTSCATDYQVLKEYQFVKIHENLIAGMEADELSRKILVTETGIGIPSRDGSPIEQKYSAERAAVLDAYRKLTERLGGMVLNANSKTANGRLTSDQVQTIAKAYLRGAKVESVVYERGMAKADVLVYINPRKEVYYHNYLEKRQWFWW
jgi:hypothetical protein